MATPVELLLLLLTERVVFGMDLDLSWIHSGSLSKTNKLEQKRRKKHFVVKYLSK